MDDDEKHAADDELEQMLADAHRLPPQYIESDLPRLLAEHAAPTTVVAFWDDHNGHKTKRTVGLLSVFMARHTAQTAVIDSPRETRAQNATQADKLNTKPADGYAWYLRIERGLVSVTQMKIS
jgi:hypothetical protein